MYSKMVKYLGFSFMSNLFGILYRIAVAIASRLFVLVLRRSILQFTGGTHIGAIRIIGKRKPQKPPDKDILTSSNNLKSLSFGAESIWDYRFVIRCDISKSNPKSLRLGTESIIANQNNQQALSVSPSVGIPLQALSVSTSVGFFFRRFQLR